MIRNFFVFFIGFLFLPASLLTGESLKEMFSPNNPSSKVVIDHSAWGNLISEYLDSSHPSGVNLFNYAKVSEKDKNSLNRYLESLSNVDVLSLNKDEQMAYWINFYNALTVKVILDHYPVKSIKKIRNAWTEKWVTVEGTPLSLDDIEHEILRPIWKDPRIHYVVNCASIGCPNLATQPYTASALNSMLDAAAVEYINHPRGISVKGRRLLVSSLYTWYSEDFGDRDEMIKHWLTYANQKTANMIRSYSKKRFRYYYDWDLNSES